MNNKEIWKDIKGYEGLYQVSSYGRVKSVGHIDSLGRVRKTAFLKLLKNPHGYKYISVFKNGIRSNKLVHRLVAQAFIPNPNNYPVINHKDENKANNCVSNLEWCTQSYNNHYGNRIKRIAKSLSMKVVQLSLNGSLVKVWSSIRDASRNGYNGSSRCCKNRVSKCKGYYWIYYSDYKKMSKKDILKYVIKRDRRIVQLDLNDHIIKIWDSNQDADKAGFLGFDITKCCKGERKSHAGYHWMFYKKILEKQLKEMG